MQRWAKLSQDDDSWPGNFTHELEVPGKPGVDPHLTRAPSGYFTYCHPSALHFA